jgi:two-component system response regulator HydG
MSALPPTRVLVVDDEPGLRRSLARVLSARGFSVVTSDDGAGALAQIAAREPDVVLCDISMQGLSGLEVLTETKRKHPRVEVVMMTAHGNVDIAVAAVKAGAYDFLTKPFASNDAVVMSVTKAAEHRALIERATHLEERLVAHERFGAFIGSSAKMQDVYRLIEGVASATSTVLILGESGTGKELVARAIHQSSPRSAKPFVPVNCAAIPKDLVESELFGHVRGAFTGAQNARAGLFETANTGTLFLDEVGELPPSAQVKLLRALQEGEIKPVGSDETRIIDVRVLSATNVDLTGAIANGTFRKDLYYRLNVIPISLPRLQDREDDVIVLAHYILEKLARRMARDAKKLSPGAIELLRAYGWPGNVRELEHALEHAFVLAKGTAIHPADLPAALRGRVSSFTEIEAASVTRPLPSELTQLSYAEAKRRALAAFDEEYVRETLRRADGNFSAAARHAGLDRSNFRRIAKKSRV